MEITSIEPRRKGLSQLYINGEQAMKLDTFVLTTMGIKVGKELTDEELYALIQASDARRAQEKALYLLEFRSHSKKELAEKIARTAASKEAAAEAVNRMEELGLLDDRAYAESLARSLINRKKYGTRRVRQELRFKGIDTEMIDEILMDYEDQDFDETIRDFLEKKYADFREDPAVKRRAIAALNRRGYDYDEIKRAMHAEIEE